MMRQCCDFEVLIINERQQEESPQIRVALPHRERRTIGAWCFCEHVGPLFTDQGVAFLETPRSENGLQSLVWIVKGELFYLGHTGYLSPFSIGCETHQERVMCDKPTQQKQPLHAIQFWLSAPDRTLPALHFASQPPILPQFIYCGVQCIVLVGEFLSHRSPVECALPLLALDLKSPNLTKITLPLDAQFEYGLLVFEGEIILDGNNFNHNQFLYLKRGNRQLDLILTPGSRLLIFGGEPSEQISQLWFSGNDEFQNKRNMMP